MLNTLRQKRANSRLVCKLYTQVEVVATEAVKEVVKGAAMEVVKEVETEADSEAAADWA